MGYTLAVLGSNGLHHVAKLAHASARSSLKHMHGLLPLVLLHHCPCFVIIKIDSGARAMMGAKHPFQQLTAWGEKSERPFKLVGGAKRVIQDRWLISLSGKIIIFKICSWSSQIENYWKIRSATKKRRYSKVPTPRSCQNGVQDYGAQSWFLKGRLVLITKWNECLLESLESA